MAKKKPKPTVVLPEAKNPCADLPSHLAAEWHSVTPPTKVGRRTPARWRCAAGHEWVASKEARARGNNCPGCALVGVAPLSAEETRPLPSTVVPDESWVGLFVYPVSDGTTVVDLTPRGDPAGVVTAVCGPATPGAGSVSVRLWGPKPEPRRKRRAGAPEGAAAPAGAHPGVTPLPKVRRAPEKKPASDSPQAPAPEPASSPALGESRVVILVDRSRSMSRGPQGLLREDAYRALNDIVARIATAARDSGVPTQVQIQTFNNYYDTPSDWATPEKVVFPQPRAHGGTSIRDTIVAALKRCGDLPPTAADGGPVSRLLFVVTDGDDMHSVTTREVTLQAVERASASGLYTIAMLVPSGARENTAKNCGVPLGNVQEWDVSDARGAEVAAASVNAGVDRYYQGRSQGVLRTARFFVDASKVDEAAVRAAGGAPLGAVRVWRVPREETIQEFVEAQGVEFREGLGYYELSKDEKLRAGRDVLLQRRAGGLRAPVFAGPPGALRRALGIPDGDVPIGEGATGEWRVLVQSTSFNRKLVRGSVLAYRTDGVTNGLGPTWRPDPDKFADLPGTEIPGIPGGYYVEHDVADSYREGSLVKLGGVLCVVRSIASDRAAPMARMTVETWQPPRS